MTLNGIMLTARYNRAVSIFEEGVWGISRSYGWGTSAFPALPTSLPLPASLGEFHLLLQQRVQNCFLSSPLCQRSLFSPLTSLWPKVVCWPLWSEKAAVKSRLWKPVHENSWGNCDTMLTSIVLVFSIVIVWYHPCFAFLYVRACPVHIFVQICHDSEDHKCDFLSWQSLRSMSTSTEGSLI